MHYTYTFHRVGSVGDDHGQETDLEHDPIVPLCEDPCSRPQLQLVQPLVRILDGFPPKLDVLRWLPHPLCLFVSHADLFLCVFEVHGLGIPQEFICFQPLEHPDLFRHRKKVLLDGTCWLGRLVLGKLGRMFLTWRGRQRRHRPRRRS